MKRACAYVKSAGTNQARVNRKRDAADDAYKRDYGNGRFNKHIHRGWGATERRNPEQFNLREVRWDDYVEKYPFDVHIFWDVDDDLTTRVAGWIWHHELQKVATFVEGRWKNHWTFDRKYLHPMATYDKRKILLKAMSDENHAD